MKSIRRIAVVNLAAFAFLLSAPAYADITLRLTLDFINKYKHRATIATECFVDVAGKVHSAKDDGDQHVAVRCDEINLAAVAEVQNAKSFSDAVATLKAAEGTGNKIPLAGAWRIWPEHGGTHETHDQRKIISTPFKTSNPDHVFEIHSVSLVDDIDVRSGWREIKGYKPKDAYNAFFHYESKRFLIEPLDGFVQMTFPGVGYNYVKYQMVLLQKPVPRNNIETGELDGYTVRSAVTDLDGEMIARDHRMVFVEGTPPAKAVKNLKVGDCLVVLGMPRISLALVSWRLNHADDSRRPLEWSMPYEMVVAAAYSNKCVDPELEFEE